MKTIDLTTRIKTWSELEHRIVNRSLLCTDEKMLVVLQTNTDNHSEAVEALIRNLARQFRNGHIKGSVTHHTLSLDAGMTILVVGTERLEECRGREFSIVFLPKEASEEVKNTVLPTLRGEKSYLYVF